MRGGKEPNYSAEHVKAAAAELGVPGLGQKVMVDFSHANSRKDYRRQMEVCEDVAGQIAGGDEHIFGVMVESHLVEGRQDLKPGCEPCYGQSITDACIDWDDTERLLATLSAAADPPAAKRLRCLNRHPVLRMLTGPFGPVFVWLSGLACLWITPG